MHGAWPLECARGARPCPQARKKAVAVAAGVDAAGAATGRGHGLCGIGSVGGEGSRPDAFRKGRVLLGGRRL